MHDNAMNTIWSYRTKSGTVIDIAREIDKYGPDGYAFYIYANGKNCIWKCETRDKAMEFVEKECL